MRKLWTIGLVATTACAGVGSHAGGSAGVMPIRDVRPASQELARATYDRLASLAGEWEGPVTGDPTLRVRLTYEVVANGNAVVETQYVPGREGDPVMISIYYMDGPLLRMDHYCAARNQPRMVLEAGSSRDDASFAFVGATGFVSPGDLHVHSGHIRILSKDRVVATWLNYQDGRHVHDNDFRLTRVGS